MRRSGLFWGGLLLLLGVLFLLNTLGILPVNVWAVFWPLALILFGLWLLIGAFSRREEFATESLSMELKGVEEARVRIRHGGGRLILDGRAAPEELLNGRFEGGVVYETQSEGERYTVDLRPKTTNFLDWPAGRGLDWQLSLNNAIPLALELETGASETQADLSDMQVKELHVRTGAGSVEATLPAAAGHTVVHVNAGAAGVTLIVPEGVAAQVEGKAGVGAVDVDRTRFPRAGGVYRSEDYKTAANRVEIQAGVGVGGVTVR